MDTPQQMKRRLSSPSRPRSQTADSEHQLVSLSGGRTERPGAGCPGLSAPRQQSVFSLDSESGDAGLS